MWRPLYSFGAGLVLVTAVFSAMLGRISTASAAIVTFVELYIMVLMFCTTQVAQSLRYTTSVAFTISTVVVLRNTHEFLWREFLVVVAL